MSMKTLVAAAGKSGQTPESMVLVRADLQDLALNDLEGRRFILKAALGSEYVSVIRTVAKVHFTPEAGLWLELYQPTLFERPLRGVQYVIEEPGLEEGWYVGLDADPRGQFFKLVGFEIQPETTPE